MKRSFRIIIFGIVLVFGWLVLGLFTTQELGDIQLTYAYTQADLIPSVDTVEINSGLMWQSVEQMVKIEEGTQVRTNETGTAQVVFADESILIIEPNTTITIQQHYVSSDETQIRIFQEVGRTWSQVKKLINPKSSYEIETHTTVATVRGTAFGVSVDQNQTVDFIVEEGQIEAQVVERVDGQRRLVAKTLINPNETAHWEKPDLKKTEFAMIEFSARPVEKDREINNWKEEIKYEVKELEPILEEIKLNRQEDLRQKLEEAKRQQGLIRKLRNRLKEKLGLDIDLKTNIKPKTTPSPDFEDGQSTEPSVSPTSPLESPQPEINQDQVRLLDQTPEPTPEPSYEPVINDQYIERDYTLFDQKL